jgi:ABC-type Zn uptake system ZnuABC Zn-binding protein ZnuA
MGRELHRTGSAVVVAVVLTLVAAACGRGGANGAGAPSADDRLAVVTTVAPITSIVAGVAGDLATVTGLVPEGTNSHTFEPPPSAAKVLSQADVVFVNGLELEEPTVGQIGRAHV